MNEGVVQAFGALTREQVAKSPQRANRLLRSAYHLVGAQSHFFPSKHHLSAREYLLAESSRNVARSLNPNTVAGIVNIFLPCEISHAMGVHPTFPEGMAVYFTAAECERAFVSCAENNGVPDSFCSYHKVLIGAVESGVIPKPRFIAHTTLACDANQLTFRRLQQYYNVPRFCVDVPFRMDEESTTYVANQLREMEEFVAKHTGFSPNQDNLRDTIMRSKDTIDNYRQYLAIRAEKSIPSDMTGEMLPLFGMHVLLGSEAALTYTRTLLQNINALPPSTDNKKRIVWMHTLPHWQSGLSKILLDSDVELLCCDLSVSGLVELDPEKPYESMARRIIHNSMNGPAIHRIENMLNFATQLRADGVVYFNHWGCKGTLGASQIAKERFEACGFPTLVLDGDGCDSGNVSNGQMATRLQAFLEQLEVHK